MTSEDDNIIYLSLSLSLCHLSCITLKIRTQGPHLPLHASARALHILSSWKNYLFLGKDQIQIHKFDGSNFALWKNQMLDVLVQRKKTRPLGGKAKNPDDMDDDNWEEFDALTMSMIRLLVAYSVYFTILDSKNSEEL